MFVYSDVQVVLLTFLFTHPNSSIKALRERGAMLQEYPK